MPIDIFAALGALVRAEASRTAPKAKPPTTTAPADKPRAQRTGNPEPPPTGAPAAASDSASTAAPAARKRPRSKVLRKLTTLASIVQKGRDDSAGGRSASRS